MTTQTIVSMPPAQGVGFRRSLMSNDPSILTEIHKDQANIAIYIVYIARPPALVILFRRSPFRAISFQRSSPLSEQF